MSTVEIKLPSLLPHQKEVVRSFRDPAIKFLWYLSGFGGGKTFIGANLSYDIAMTYKGIRGAIIRDTLVNLKNTSLKTFLEVCPNPNGSIFQLKASDKSTGSSVIKFPATGAEILLIGLDNPSDIAKLQSLEIGFFWCDEVDGISETIFSILQKRLRQANKENPEMDYPRKGFITSNSAGQNWTYNLFEVENKDNKQYKLIKSTSFDNVHLPDDYVQDLKDWKDEEMKKRFVYAEFDVFEGQIYKEFNRAVHVVEPFDIPSEWDYGAVLDHGFRNPTAIIYYAIDYDGNIFIYDEHYVAEKTPKFHSANLKDHGLSECMADPSVFNKNQTNGDRQYSIADEYSDYGIALYPAQNDHSAGRSMVKQYLQDTKIFFFSNCTHTIRTLAQLKWQPPVIRGGVSYNREEEANGQEDHLPDCVRYLCLSRPYESKKIDTTKTPIMDILRSRKKEIIKYSSFEDIENEMLNENYD